jgi:Domain of unknown function (DUF4397)
MNTYHRFAFGIVAGAFAGCGGSSSSSSTLPAATQPAKARYVDGAPELEALINGTPQSIGVAYLQLDSQTVVSLFSYGTMSSFSPVAAGTHSVFARSTSGYFVGPLKTTALSPGKRYTLVVVGSYRHYRVLSFEEPAPSDKAAISLYEASPGAPKAAFGSFKASTQSNFKQLGSGRFGTLGTVPLGKNASDVGGYVGTPSRILGKLAPSQINSFDLDNVLPFQRQSRLSLFLFDPENASKARLFGSLDQ